MPVTYVVSEKISRNLSKINDNNELGDIKTIKKEKKGKYKLNILKYS